ncbi:hypothetical protein D3C81_1277600 [compost metagenome]
MTRSCRVVSHCSGIGGLMKLITPPTLFGPYCTAAPPRTTSMRSTVARVCGNSDRLVCP